MNNKEQKQLLSAYFDNEVTPEERKQIEQLLESSDDARQVLDQTGQVSELIRLLPKHPAPETLSAAVMQQTETETPSTAPSTKNSSTSRGRSWFRWTSGLVTTAVVLFVATHYLLKPKPVLFENNAETNLGTGDEVAFNEDEGIDIDDFFGTESDSDGGMDMLTTETPDVSGTNTKTRVASVAESTPAEGGHNRVDRITPLLPPPQNDTAGGSGQARMSVASNKVDAHRRAHLSRTNFRDVNWKTVQVGEMFDYDELSNGEVTIVEVTVVDVQKAMGEMQMLLARNSIPDVTLKERNEKLSIDNKEVKAFQKAKQKARQSALFVETSQMQLTKTLTALQQHDLFLNVQPTVNQVASIDFTNQFASLNSNGRYESNRQVAEEQKETKNKFNGKEKETTEERPMPANALADAKALAMKKTTKADEEAQGIASSGLRSKRKNKNVKQLAKIESPSISKDQPSPSKRKRQLQKSYQMIVAVNNSASMPPQSPAMLTPQAMSTKNHLGKKDKKLQTERVASSPKKSLLDGNKSERSLVSKGAAFESSTQSKPVRVLFIFSKTSTPAKKATLKLKQN